VVTYLIEAYVAGADIDDVRARAEAVAAVMNADGHAIRYLRSMFLREDETCFHLVEAASEASAAELARRAELGHQRIVEAEELFHRDDAEAIHAAPHKLKGEHHEQHQDRGSDPL
jgi:multidrug resistance efflux pump